MSNSDTISLVAVVIAVAFGIANFWYTRRTFAVSFKPVIVPKYELETHASSAFSPRYLTKARSTLTISNLSNTTAIRDLKISLSFKAYKLGISSSRIPPKDYLRRFIDSLAPTRTQTVGQDPNDENQNILQFIANEYPSIITYTKSPNSNLSYYHIPSPFQLEMITTFSYIPAVHGARRVNITKINRYTSITDLGPDGLPMLSGWKVS